MSNLNKVMLMGRLTNDLETRYTASNTAVANFGLAINRTYSVGEGDARERREDVTFVDCEVWGRQAEVMKQYLSKGRPVFIEGRLKQDKWQDKDGNNRSKTLVVVESFQFIDSKGGGGGGGEGGGGQGSGAQVETYGRRPAEPAARGNDHGATAHEAIDEGDIPF